MDYKYVIENSFYVDSNYRISLVALTVDIGAPFLFIIGKKRVTLQNTRLSIYAKYQAYGVWRAGNIFQIII